MIAFNMIDPALPGSLRWKIARHEYSSYDAELRTARNPATVFEQYALAAMQYAAKTKDRALAIAVMEWARTKRVIN